MTKGSRKPLSDGCIYYLNCVMASQVDAYVRTQQTVCFKYVKFTVYQLYLSKAVNTDTLKNKNVTLLE